MENKELDLIKKLMAENNELKQLMDEHEQYEKKLEELSKVRYLSEEEQMEKKRLQKLKLAGRDKIEKILTLYRG